MFSTEAAITIKQKNKTERSTSIQLKVDLALSYNGAKTSRLLVNILSKAAPKMDGQREARKRESADVQMEKGEKKMIDEHLKLCLVLFQFTKIIKNKFKKHC